MGDEGIIDLYERHARAFDRDRSRSLQEQTWLDRFLGHVRPASTVLDVGCGMAEPIARYVIERGFRVVGIDSSPSMIAMCRARFPGAEWLVADMRRLALGRRFDGILAWDSFFHLRMDAQRAMFARFAAHAGPARPCSSPRAPRKARPSGAATVTGSITRAWIPGNTSGCWRRTGSPSARTSPTIPTAADTRSGSRRRTVDDDDEPRERYRLAPFVRQISGGSSPTPGSAPGGTRRARRSASGRRSRRR
jgi:SAM-dependent methyltransferase